MECTGLWLRPILHVHTVWDIIFCGCRMLEVRREEQEHLQIILLTARNLRG